MRFPLFNNSVQPSTEISGFKVSSSLWAGIFLSCIVLRVDSLVIDEVDVVQIVVWASVRSHFAIDLSSFGVEIVLTRRSEECLKLVNSWDF